MYIKKMWHMLLKKFNEIYSHSVIYKMIKQGIEK